MKNLFHLFIALLMLIVASCTTDPVIAPTVVLPYEKGAFVVNEGQFGSGTGTITHYNPTTKAVTQDVFGKENAGAFLGNVAQSITVSKDLAFVVVNNANLIQVVSANTFKTVGKIEGLASPRYFLPINDQKAYISQWGADGLTGALVVYDLVNKKIQSTVLFGKGEERMLLVGNKVYVALSGGYGLDNRVLIMDATTDKVISTIAVPDAPSNFVIDAKGAIWVICKGYYDFAKAKYTDGGLVKIVNDKVEGTPTKLNGGCEDLVIDNTKNVLYYQEDGAVKKADITSGKPVISLLSPKYYYGLAVDPATNNLFAADAGDFKSNGKVDVISPSGAVLSTFAAGVGVSDVWFK